MHQNLQQSDAGQELKPTLWLEKLNNNLSTDKWVRFIVTAYTLWRHRNSIVHDKGSWQSDMVKWMIAGSLMRLDVCQAVMQHSMIT